MLRGINQQQIFEDSEDFEKFLQVLNDCKAISEFKIFAYCLMGNHIHLLIQEIKEPIGGAHTNYQETADNMKKAILNALEELSKLSVDKLREERYEKFRAMGRFIEK